MLSKDLGYIKPDDFKALQRDIEEVERMLKALIKSLQNKHSNPPALRDLPFYGTPLSAKIILRCGAAVHKF